MTPNDILHYLSGIVALALAAYLLPPAARRFWQSGRPVRCWQCRRWRRAARTRERFHRVAGYVRICVDCADAAYRPWTRDGSHE